MNLAKRIAQSLQNTKDYGPVHADFVKRHQQAGWELDPDTCDDYGKTHNSFRAPIAKHKEAHELLVSNGYVPENRTYRYRQDSHRNYHSPDGYWAQLAKANSRGSAELTFQGKSSRMAQTQDDTANPETFADLHT